ncbi:MAG: hypothetical protein KDC44_03645 [Phaeodactylibacter sp.]|nr:hypothetical protein [Phaeodactylibacter sp.]
MYFIKSLAVVLVFTLINCTVKTSSPSTPPTETGVGSSSPATTTAVPTADPQPAAMQGMLETHNAYRSEVGVPPLQWSDKLAQVASEWATELQRRGCKMEHRPHSGQWDSPYGENIYWSKGMARTPTHVAENWADEKASFDYEHANYSNFTSNGKVVGHYTQMVWRQTTHVGCAMRKCGDAEIWVCNYEPAGNWMGQRPY